MSTIETDNTKQGALAVNSNAPLARALWSVDQLGGDSRTGKCFCPSHDDEPKPSFDVSLTSFTAKGLPLFTCRAGCEQDAVIAALRGRGLWPIPGTLPPISAALPIQNRTAEERRQYALRIFKGVKARDWDPLLAEDYFRKRGLKFVPDNAWLTMPVPNGGEDYQLLSDDPGIVFRVRDRDNKFLGIHVIWLNDDMSCKREAAPQRQCYGPIKGGFVQIGEVDPDKPLIIAEGVETATAVLQITGLPCALVGCGENTANMNLPDHAEIIIAADNGDAGQKTANTLAQRHARPDYVIRIATPVKPEGGKKGYDWNDAVIDGADPGLMRETILKAPIFEQLDDDDHAQNAAAKQVKQVDTLINLASEADLFHDDDKGYADISVDGHRETWPVNSKGFRSWLLHRYYKQEETAPSGDSLRRAIETIGARAQFDGPTRDVHIRVGGHAGKIYLDLCDPQWRAVEIDAADWRVISDPPVRFRRAAGMLPLPVPVKGGSVEDLRPFVNLGESSFVLLIGYLAATLRDKGPYPGLAIMGAEGTAKSTLMRVIGKLVDPHKVPERHPPREARDLFIHAIRARLLSFGNVSNIPDWLSDALCSLATGGGFATRELYTDTEEILFDAMRPFVLNGIEFITRSDLADRLIYFKLLPISDQDRCTEQEFWEAFERQRPSILGGLLDVVCHGLRAWPNTASDEAYPRMADFARWATACEGALWEPGTFAEAYANNRNRANIDVIEGEAIATAILRLMKEEDGDWSGTAAELLDRLEAIVGEKEARRRHWPGSAPVLGARLRRIQERLRRVGIKVSYGRKGLAGTRIINIRQIEGSQNAVSPVSSVRTVRPQRNGTDSAVAGTVRRAVSAKSLPDHGTDSADSADSRLQSSSNGAA